ncbi:MAG: sigma-54-dependent transcriptional regulator [Pontibacterium sp.]
MKGQVLLIDDEQVVRESTADWLSLSGFDVTTSDDPVSALSLVNEDAEFVIVSDVRMPNLDGLALLAQVHQQVPEFPVILITGHGDVDMALQAMRLGAYDFIEKPFIPERFAETVERACDKRRLMLENRRLQSNLASQCGIDSKLIGTSPAIVRLKRQLLKCASLDTNVIIYGETGAGKELVAQCLHDFSQRKAKHFVPLNCAAIPDSLIESELFGHEAGAFTGAAKRRIGKFEYADKGTLFLDEIESMPMNIQVKALRALQEGTIERLGGNQSVSIDIRVVAAAKVDLLSDEQFRDDLYYRLNVSQLHIPPLREREEDIPLLFEHFVRLAADRQGVDERGVSQQDISLMQGYLWPGNVRELKNIATRYALDLEVSLSALLYPGSPSISEKLATKPQVNLPLAAQVADFEKEVIERALMRYQGNIKEVMAALDLPRRTLNQKMAKFGLCRSQYVED